MTTLRPRWSRFSLRTMFVVVSLLAAPLAWIVSQARWARERQMITSTPLTGFTTGQPPPSLRLFTDQGFEMLWLRETESPEKAREIKRLFPEAWVHQTNPYPLGDTEVDAELGFIPKPDVFP